MPARRDYTPEELAARLERERERARIRQANWRARHRVTVTTNEGSRNGHVVTVTPLQTSPLGGNGLNGGEAKAVEAILAPFEAARGYLHDVRFLAKMRQQYPGIDLELEALKAAEWLMEPRNANRRCSKAFLDRWLKKAAADASSGVAPPPTAARTGYPNAPYAPPISRQGRNPGPPDLPLFDGPVQRIDPGEMARFVAARRDVPLADKLARRNGRKA